jgi:DNA-binding IclR family transcriptional regulator
MARPNPGTERMMALLNFLASRPRERFSLSELCRRLDLSKATAHAQVGALVAGGFLLRHPVDKSYSLGPALIAIGNAAGAGQYEVVEEARGAMSRLADELDVQCVASAAFGAEMVMLAHAGRIDPLGVTVEIGGRIPLVPPLGTVFMAWSEPDEIDDWLHRLGPGAGEDRLGLYRDAILTVRRRGYSLGLDSASRARLQAARVPDREVGSVVDHLGHEEYILLELEQAASYDLSLVAAPVFGAGSEVALAITLFGFRAPLRGRDVPAIAERLCEETRAVTKAIGGVAPGPG